MSSARIYLIRTITPGKPRLVRAANRAQALAYITRTDFEAKVADQDDLVRCLTGGIAVEDASADPAPIVEEDDEEDDPIPEAFGGRPSKKKIAQPA